MIDLLVIAGPTASGKSRIAVECAKLYDGEVISADSMQIYKCLDIGTAKITFQEMDGVPHHMIDIIEPNQQYSVSEYVAQVHDIIQDIRARGKLPILCGGTGLYIKALLYGYDFGRAPKDESTRQKYEELFERYGKDYVYDMLIKRSPELASNIHPNATKRVIRALEMLELNNGKMPTQAESKYNYLMIVLDLDRQELYNRINSRVDAMVEDGLIEEMTRVLKHIPATSQSMQAIGYKELFPYLNGECSLEECISKLKQNTRNYAKRQLTFFRSFKEAVWMNPKDSQAILNLVGEYYGKV